MFYRILRASVLPFLKEKIIENKKYENIWPTETG